MSQSQRSIASLASLELQDGIYFYEFCETARKIGIVLDPIAFGLDTPSITPVAEQSPVLANPPPSTSEYPVCSNPLIKLALFFTKK